MLCLCMAACSKSAIEESSIPVADTPTLYAEIADESASRTYLEQAKYMRWHADDEISAFLGNTLNQRYGFDGKTGANSGTFSQVSYQLGTGNPIEEIRAFYPYAASTSFDDISGKVNYIFPKLQKYGEGDTYGQGANPMVATSSSTSDTFLYFRNICGFLKLQLYGDDVTVKAILVKGNQAEKLSGASVITAEYNTDPSVAMADEATEGVVLDCGEGVVLSEDANNPTLFWIAIPPTTFEGGFTITIKGDNGKGHIQSTTKQRVITRNEYLQMPAFAVVCNQEINEEDFQENAQTEEQVVIPNNQIWYSTKNGMAYDITKGGEVDPKTLFGANLLSNIYYPEGYGVITFDGDVTKVASGAFRENKMLTDIKLSNSVTAIGDAAFLACLSLKSVTLGNQLRSIGAEAFYGATSLTSIVLPEGLETIGDAAFSDCSALTEVTLPNSVTTLGSGAFVSCSSLNSVTISEQLETLASTTFADCRSLTSVTIPAGVKTIEDHVFWGCTSLSTIYCNATTPPTLKDATAFENNAEGRRIYVPSFSVDAYQAQWSDYASSIFSPLPNNEIHYTATEKITPNYITKFGATYLPEQSTYNSETKEGVLKFESDVIKIGTETFSDCTSLTSMSIPNSVQMIDRGAFKGCSSLTSVSIPNSVKTISTEAFAGCTSLTSVTIPDSVTTIGVKAFYGCSWLTSATIGNGVTTIWDSAFNGCSSLASVTIGNGVTEIGASAFRDCTSLGSITIPDGVTTIGYQAFYRCASLTSITIPDSVTEIGSSAFRDCTSLGSITIPDGVTTIGDGAFRDCTSLSSITIPNSVTEIGTSAFGYCSSLGSITIPDGVTTIGYQAFYRCASLTSITIPDSVTEIGSSAFRDCTSLASITIPNSVTTIGDNAFTGCTSLKEFKGEGASSDGRCLIIDGTLHTFIPDESTSYTIPDGVTKIGRFAFEDCTSLTSITIPESVTMIGYCAFLDCTSLASITIPDSVTEIRASAFSGCASLGSITIPDGVTTIGEEAFHSCTSLTSAAIGNSVTTIGYNAFAGCTSLKEFKGKGASSGGKCLIIDGTLHKYIPNESTSYTIPDGVTEIGASAFEDCSSLGSITVPNSVTKIGSEAFAGCSSLTSITMPESVTLFGSAFTGCSSLVSITIPNGVSDIVPYTFQNCSSLTSVTIPNSVTMIAKYAFEGCSSLPEVTIPENVTSIAQDAFRGCSSLKTVYCKPLVPPRAYSRIFDQCTSLETIDVPDEAIEEYKVATTWAIYATYIK